MVENILIKNGIEAYNEKNYNAALKYFNKYFNEIQNERDYRVYYYTGLAYTQLGNYDEAIENFRKLIRIKIPPEMAIQFRMILGYIYSVRNDYALAKTIFESVLKINENYVQAMESLGYIFHKMGEDKKAITIFKKAIKLDKKNPNLHNSLGYIYANMKGKTKQAIKECQTALKLNPDYPAYLDSLGWAYFKAGKLAEAKKYLTQALDSLPEQNEVKEHFRQMVVKDMTSKHDDQID